MADRDVTIDILGRDKTDGAAKSATRNFERLDAKVKATSKDTDRFGKVGDKVSKSMATAAKAVAKVAATVASVGSLVGPAVTGLFAAAKGAVALGKAGASLAPLAAFLPSMVGSVGLLVGTVKLAGPAFAKALTPITRQFFDADGNASKLTKRVQALATKGVGPLAAGFVKLNMPTIGKAMERIATATNHVVVGVGKWVNTIAGQQLIAQVSNATAKAAETLAPKITAASIAVGNLAKRAGDRGITGFASLIGTIVDKFTAWANGTSTADINKALSNLALAFDKLKAAWGRVKGVIDWLAANRAKVKAFSTALGLVGIALGVLSGNWPAVVIGAFSLVANHWKSFQSTFSAVPAWWDGVWAKVSGNSNLQHLGHTISGFFTTLVGPVKATFDKIAGAVGPQLSKLKDVILNQLVPAISDFIEAVKPMVAWLVDKLGPVLAKVWAALVAIIRGAVEVISGIINVFTGLLTGNWSKVWEGIKQIFKGVWDIVVAVLKAALAIIVGLWSMAKNAIISGAQAIVGVFLSTFGMIINGAVSAFGWIPGIGPKLKSAQQAFNRFKDGVNSALQGLKDKTVTIHTYITGAGKKIIENQGSVRVAGEGLNIAASGGVSWARNFAMDGGAGASRTGGPTPVSVNSNVTVNLDGAPFRAMTATAISGAERRQDWRNRMRRR
jgi:phage-related protein